MNLPNFQIPDSAFTDMEDFPVKQRPLLLLLDDSVDQLTICSYLNSLGFVITAASTASDGLQLLQDHTYEGILVDFNLPQMDRLPFLEQIRYLAHECPIVVITPPDDSYLADTVIQLGATDVISKNMLTSEAVCRTFFNALRLHRAEKKRRQAEERLKTLQHQLEFVICNTPLNAWNCDSRGIITYLSGQVFTQLGIDTQCAIGCSYMQVFQAYPDIINRFSKVLSGEQVQAVTEVKGMFFKTNYMPVREKQSMRYGVTGLAFDITDQIRHQRELTRAKEQAEESLKTKEQFLANISHEIRTPMNGIIGLSKILAKTPLNQDQERYLNAIQSSSNNLMHILNDLLDIAKITANKISFTLAPFKLQELVQETQDLMEGVLNARSNTFIADIAPNVPAVVEGDSLRLRQILLNLIGNAAKFTQNGFIKLSVSVLSYNETEICLQFSVEDSGIGIKQEYLHEIFESFNQGCTDTTRKFGGTGLGLTITKNLVEMQGGQISVNSKPEEGSIFTFFLPFKLFRIMDTEENKDNLNNQLQEQPFHQLRILLAEDNEINQLLVNTVLDEWGCQTDTVGNGKEALTKLKSNNYDLVLMDMQMPEMDGYEAIMKIRQSGAQYAKIPIIALTAHATTSEVEKCLATGADGYLSKPFEPEELHQNIVRLTNEYRSLHK